MGGMAFQAGRWVSSLMLVFVIMIVPVDSTAGSGGLLERVALGCNHRQQFVPGFHK
jgi:hypothetical protein